jgi:hypothetical protein
MNRLEAGQIMPNEKRPDDYIVPFFDRAPGEITAAFFIVWISEFCLPTVTISIAARSAFSDGVDPYEIIGVALLAAIKGAIVALATILTLHGMLYSPRSLGCTGVGMVLFVAVWVLSHVAALIGIAVYAL